MESPTGANYSADDPGTSATTPTDSASDEVGLLWYVGIDIMTRVLYSLA